MSTIKKNRDRATRYSMRIGCLLAALFFLAPFSAAQESATDPATDLEVREVRLVSESYDRDNPIRFEVLIANSGTARALPSAVSVFQSGSKIGEIAVPSLGPGETHTVVGALPAPDKEQTLRIVVAVRPAAEDLARELSFRNNAGRLALQVIPRGPGQGGLRSVMWMTEPLYVVDAPYRIEPWVNKVPLLIMIVNELPNENGWDPDLDSFNHIRLWVNGTRISDLEGSFTVPNTRFWAKVYEIPVSHFGKVDDYNLVRVNLDLSWADDRGPDIQPQNSAWGNIDDPMTGAPLDDATWLSDGDYWYCRVYRSSHRLPNIDGSRWFYGDTHFHTVYTDNSGEMGSPVYASAYAGKTMGLSWLCVTDHSNDYDSAEDAENFKDGLPHEPFTRPQPQSTTAKWTDFLGEVAAVNATGLFSVIAGSEVNFAILQEDFPSVPADCFAHALVYGLEGAAQPVKGEGQDGMALFSPIGKDAEKGFSGNIPAGNTSVYDASRRWGDTYTLAELLSFLQANHPGAAVFLAHPIDTFDPNSASWTNLKMRDPWYEQGGAFPYEAGVSASYHHPLFKGFEFWNGRAGYGNGIGHDQTQVTAGNAKYHAILQQDLTSFDPSKKLFIVAGSDAHGDFNSHTSRGELYNWNILQKRRDLVQVMGKVRTAVYVPDGNVTPQSALDALKQGHAVLSSGPMAVLTLGWNGTEYFPGDHVSIPRSQLPGLKLRIRWVTSPEFGPFKQVKVKVVGPTTVREPIDIANPPNTGQRIITIKGTLPGFSGWYALLLSAHTDQTQALFREPGTTYPYRCLANPIWLEIKD